MNEIKNIKIKINDNNNFVLFQKIAFSLGFKWKHMQNEEKQDTLSFFGFVNIGRFSKFQKGVLLKDGLIELTNGFCLNSSFNKSNFNEITCEEYINKNGINKNGFKIISI
jgi:hypothetical protein